MLRAKLFFIFLIGFICVSVPAYSDDSTMKKLGVEKTTTDTHNLRTDTYSKDMGETKGGTKYGVYGSSTKEYKNPNGERDTSANEKQGSGSVGAGVIIKY